MNYYRVSHNFLLEQMIVDKMIEDLWQWTENPQNYSKYKQQACQLHIIDERYSKYTLKLSSLEHVEFLNPKYSRNFQT